MSARTSSWLAPVPPTVAIEIARRRVTVVELGRSSGGPVVNTCASETLPEGLVTPGLTGPNVPEPGPVVEALGRALARAGLRSAGRAALVIPDSVARVSLLTFEKLPARAADLDQLVRWQLRKATPFPIDDAQVTHFPASADAAGVLLAAVASRRDVVAQYEAVTDALGIRAGIVDLASLNVMNAVVAAGAAPPGDWLLVHLAAEGTTLAILRGSNLLFYRHRMAVEAEPLAALVHQTAMYHEDRLGTSQFTKVWLSGATLGHGDGDAARREISDRLGIQAEAVDIRPAASLGSRVTGSPDVLDSLAAPVGVLLRERKAA
jgi:Tfp pilus assembly PilM family ATPase